MLNSPNLLFAPILVLPKEYVPAVVAVGVSACVPMEQRRAVKKVNKIFLIMIMVFGYCSRVKSIKTSHARTQKCPSVIKKCVKIRL